MAQSPPTPDRADPAPSPGTAGSLALLTTIEAAALLRVHPKQVYRLAARGLPRLRVGSEWRYDREQLLLWSGGGRSASAAHSGWSVVASNGDLVVSGLLRHATHTHGPVYGLAITDRTTGVQWLRERRVLATGYHGTSFPASAPEGRFARIHLVRRDVGLVAAAGRTPRVEDLLTARLASRRPSAGVRTILDESLRSAEIDPAPIAKRATICDSHGEIVSAVARGAADLGITTQAWAWASGLSFHRLATEDYGLLCFADDLGRPEIVRLCETAQSDAFRATLTPEMGYDASACGRILLDPAQPGASATDSSPQEAVAASQAIHEVTMARIRSVP